MPGIALREFHAFRASFHKSSEELFRIATNKLHIAMMINNLRNGEAPREVVTVIEKSGITVIEKN